MKEADFGKKARVIYFVCCIIGSLLTLYLRNVFYAQYSYSYEGCPIQKFNKPWFATLMMALGMALANIVYKLMTTFSKEPPIAFSKINFALYLHAWLPAALDIIVSVLYSISILLIGTTFSTIIRFSLLIFATILKRFWLKETILPYSWISIIAIVVGVILVSVSVTIDEIGKMVFNGKFFIAATVHIVAQIGLSFQVIREEQLLHENDIHPAWLCGVEGAYEFVMILFIIYPIINFMPEKYGEGLVEDLCEACSMVIHSPTLICCFSVYLLIACFFNIAVMGVEYTSSAVHYLVSENIVSCISWAIDLLIKYAMGGSIFGLTEKTYGTEWNAMSFLRLIGVCIIILGSFVYIKVFKFSCFTYEESSVKMIKMSDV